MVDQEQLRTEALALINRMEIQGLVSDYLEADSYIVMTTDPELTGGLDVTRGLSFAGTFTDLDEAWKYGQMLVEELNRGTGSADRPFEFYVMPCFKVDEEHFEKWKEAHDG